MKILIVGGCFISQYNIDFDRLYHQTLKNRLIDSGMKPVEVETLRYERIGKTLEKIAALNNKYEFDLLIFHLRTEPFMRLVKLYYKYIGNNERLQHAFNLPFFNVLMPEKYELYTNRRINISNNSEESKTHYYLRELNYRLGGLIGNKKHAMKLYKKFIDEVAAYCNENNKKFLLLGPASRPFSKYENKLSYTISKVFLEYSAKQQIEYLELVGERTKLNELMFFPNGQHVSQAGHDEIAEKIIMQMANPVLVKAD